jgi:hypothetical protein
MSVSTGEAFEFRSQSEASKFLGRNHGYINFLAKSDKEYALSKSGEKYTYQLVK